jgi:hypothetical protein
MGFTNDFQLIMIETNLKKNHDFHKLTPKKKYNFLLCHSICVQRNIDGNTSQFAYQIIFF